MSTLKELRQKAKESGVKGYTKMKRDDLLSALGTELIQETGMSLSELKAKAKSMKIKGFSRLKKSELMAAIESAIEKVDKSTVPPIKGHKKGTGIELKASTLNLEEVRNKRIEALARARQARELLRIERAEADERAKAIRESHGVVKGGTIIDSTHPPVPITSEVVGGSLGLARDPRSIPVEVAPADAMNQPVDGEEQARMGAGVDITDEKAPVATKRKVRVAGVAGGSLVHTGVSHSRTDRAGEDDNQGFHEENKAVPQNTVEQPDRLVEEVGRVRSVDVPIGGNHVGTLPMARTLQPRSIRDYKVDVAYRASRANSVQGVY